MLPLKQPVLVDQPLLQVNSEVKEMNEKPIAAGKSSFDLVDPEMVFAELRLQPETVFLGGLQGTESSC